MTFAYLYKSTTGWKKSKTYENSKQYFPKTCLFETFQLHKGEIIRTFLNNWNIVYNKCKHLSNSSFFFTIKHNILNLYVHLIVIL